MRRGLRFAGATVAALSAILLTGCMTPLQHIQVTLDGDLLVFRPCYPTGTVDTVRIAVGTDATSDRELAWVAEGEGAFGPDKMIEFGVAPLGFESTTPPIEFDPTENFIYFAMLGFEGGVRFTDTLHFDGRDLIPGKWLDERGQLSKTPCP